MKNKNSLNQSIGKSHQSRWIRVIIACLIALVFVHISSSYAAADAALAVNHLNAVMDKYNSISSNELRFLESYETLGKNDPAKALDDTAFVYDNALALLAYLQQKNPDNFRRAKILADSFVYAAAHDRHYHDSRLRNAYSAKRLINPDNGSANIAGRWDDSARRWREDKDQVSTHTGNLAWVIIALSQFYAERGGESYKTTAMGIGNWIYNNTFAADGGYTGGCEGWEPHPDKLKWKSTEHNMDVFVAFRWLAQITQNNVWQDRALHAKRFVDAMWSGDHFWIGTTPDSNIIDKNHPALDLQAWAILAFEGYRPALRWAERYCYTEADSFKGFDFNTDKDGIWFEGTAQMSLAYLAIKETAKADMYLGELARAQTSAHNANGKGLVAASRDNLTTGLEAHYFSRLHIGATAWYVFAKTGWNPYSGKRYRTTPN